MSKAAQKNMMTSMEYLMDQLHKEWDRTGETNASVIISLEDADGINQSIAGQIVKTQQEVECEYMTFQDSVRLSREAYILLRLAKKVKTMENKANDSGKERQFCVKLDKDEYNLYQEVTGRK